MVVFVSKTFFKLFAESGNFSQKAGTFAKSSDRSTIDFFFFFTIDGGPDSRSFRQFHTSAAIALSNGGGRVLHSVREGALRLRDGFQQPQEEVQVALPRFPDPRTTGRG